MGSTNWSRDFYEERARDRRATGTPDFAYSTAVAQKPRHEQKTHEKLDPKGVKVREARDSVAHPESLAIMFFLDVTGSMSSLPGRVQAALPKLMTTLVEKGHVAHPQILFGAVGDAHGDQGSLQVGQFESGIEMDEDIRNIWVESRGGSGSGSKYSHESYQNAVYFAARHTALDCLEKRNQKGFLFLCGDEMPYETVKAEQIRDLIGAGLEGDISTTDIIREAQEKFHVFFIIPGGAYNSDDPDVRRTWERYLGADHVITLSNVDNICETVSGAVSLTLGTSTLESFTEGLSGNVRAALHNVAVATNRVGDATPKATVARL